jgi:hypothetical protein
MWQSGHMQVRVPVRGADDTKVTSILTGLLFQGQKVREPSANASLAGFTSV